MRKAGWIFAVLFAAGLGYGIAQLRKPPAPEATAQQPAAQPDLTDLSPEERDNVRIYQEVNRSVVNINTRGAASEDLFSFAVPRDGSGSGSVLDKQGHILTNNHVVEDARQITVNLFDGSTHPAKLVGADPSNDLAVIKIEVKPDQLYPITWGDSSKLLVGVRVFALGNPFGLERTLTTGIVSSLNRTLRTENRRLVKGVIQTDAAINPGNSGGPLLNRRGELVGITTAIFSRVGQSSGIGMAIPANPAKRVVDELIQNGRVIRPDSGILSVYEMAGGVLIGQLDPDGPAAKVGLRGPQIKETRRGPFVTRSIDRSKADLVVAVDGKRVRTLDDLLSYIETKKPGEQVTLLVVRDGEKTEVPLTLEQTKERER